MAKEKSKATLIECANLIVPFGGPLIFEISNSVTGDWITSEQQFNFSGGKIITIVIGIVYIGIMIYLLRYNIKEKKDSNVLSARIADLSKKLKNHEKSNETVCTLIAYLRRNLKEQVAYFKDCQKIDVRNLNINSASATICKVIYQNIVESNGEEVKVTVNMYDKVYKDGNEYSIMIAHEGHVSQPDAFGVHKILKPDKTNTRFCDRIIMSNSADYKILLSKKDVAKAFGQTASKCKYNQYLGLPIRKEGGKTIALIEIVAHGDTVIWDNEISAKKFAANYCEILKEYVLLVDGLYEQGEVMARKFDEGGV